MKLTPVLSSFWDQKDSFTIEGYKRNNGYKALEKALSMSPDDVIKTVKDSGLRGRGGAGFPTGMKWGFIPQGDNKEHYFVVNADESEPGTCKDMPLLLANPHSLVEGIIIGSYAIRANHAFIYIRGEVVHIFRRVQQAIDDAYKAGYLGKNILGKGFDLELTLHAGAGAYICGEETASRGSSARRRSVSGPCPANRPLRRSAWTSLPRRSGFSRSITVLPIPGTNSISSPFPTLPPAQWKTSAPLPSAKPRCSWMNEPGRMPSGSGWPMSSRTNGAADAPQLPQTTVVTPWLARSAA